MRKNIVRGKVIALMGLIAGVCAGEGRAATVSLTAGQDTTIYEDATGSLANGSGEYVFAGRTSTPMLRRALFWFDVQSMVPSSAVITSASLRLHLSSSGSGMQPMTLHTVLADWGEGASNAGFPGGAGAPSLMGDATWVHTFYDDQFWTTPGGDFTSAASASRDVGFMSDFVTWQSAGLAADVQNWLAHPTENHGWILLGDEGVDGSAKRFDSRENLTEAFRPQLVLEFTDVPGPSGLAMLGIGWAGGLRTRRRRKSR